MLIRENGLFSTGEYYDYSVVLFYSESYFLAEFSFSAKKYVEPMIACLVFGPMLDIWSDAENWTVAWIQKKIDFYNKAPFKSIEEVSSITPSSFKESIFYDGTDICFEISP